MCFGMAVSDHINQNKSAHLPQSKQSQNKVIAGKSVRRGDLLCYS